MRILLIEPNTVLAKTYETALMGAGHAVDCQPSAQAAILAIDEARPDLILLELNLPAHNGVEFLYELRSYPEWQDIPVLVHSFSRAEDLPVHESVKNHLGISVHLYKPQTTLEELVTAIDSFIAVA